MLSRIILFLLALTLGIQAMGKNSVTVEVVDENATGAPELELSTHGLSNMEDCTTIRLGLTSKSAPLQIFKVELRTRNGVYEPTEPFSFSKIYKIVCIYLLVNQDHINIKILRRDIY